MEIRINPTGFEGWKVGGSTFVLSMFGWGIGFDGPPIFRHAVLAARGWPIVTVAAAVTLHFLFGALVVANLPRLYGRLGIPTVTKAGAVALALGEIGRAHV